MLSPAPSQVVAPGGKSLASQASLTHCRNVRVSSDLMATVLPSSSAMRPPYDWRTDIIVLPSPTLERAKPMPKISGGFCACFDQSLTSCQVVGGGVSPFASRTSLREKRRFPDEPKGMPFFVAPVSAVAASIEGYQPPWASPILV